MSYSPGARPATAIFLVLFVACDPASGDALGPVGAGDAGPGPSDPGAGAVGCPEIDAERDLLELHALALALAPAVVVGRPGPIEGARDRWFRAFDIDEVRYGVAAMRGQRVWMDGDRADLEAITDAPHVAAFGAFNSLPVDDDGRRVWRPHVLRPLADSGALEPLGYKREPASVVAVVRIAEQGEQTIYEVTEVLRGGELPTRLVDPWVTPRRVPRLPGPGDATYIASFRHLLAVAVTGETVGVAVDLRDDTPAHRAAVAAAFEEPPPLDVAEADAAIVRLRSAWNYGRAERVVRAEVDGVANDNGTGAGGMALRNRVVDMIRGPELASFVHGGHAAFFDETCGATQLYALGDDVQPAAPGGADFRCDGRGRLPPFEQLFGVLDRRAATPDDEATVRAWATAHPPLLRLWPEDAAVAAGDATEVSGSPLSARPDWPELLAHGRWTWARVASRATVEGATVVSFEIPFTPHPPSGPPAPPVSTARAVTRCALPELAVQTTWLLGYFAEPSSSTGGPAIGPRTSMLFAGPWIDGTEANRRTLNALASEVWSRR